MKARKILATVLAVAMIAGMLCISAAATSTTQLDVTGNERMTSISVTTTQPTVGVSKTFTSSNFTYQGVTYTNTRYVYDISLPGNVANGDQVSVTLNPESPAFGAPVPPIPQFFGMLGANYASGGPYTINANLSNGTASMTAYVHKRFSTVRNNCDTYTFNFCIYYPISISTGDPAYIDWTGVNGTVKGSNDPTVIPASFTLWAEASTITVNNVSTNPDYSNSGNYAYTITPSTSANTVIQATISGTTYTITCPPCSETLPAGKSPTSVVSFLPIGQFATGGGWGTSNGKFANKTSLDSTGVSLGALGGYIEFYFARGIKNDSKNPYGVDFVVYGNAFAGNPEAGAVQVSENGTTWYELAGSKYYDGGFNYVGNQGASGKYSNAYTGTLRNTSVAYSLITGTGIYANFGGHNDLFTTAAAWWPTTNEGYPMGTPNTNSVVTVSHSDTALSFGGITAIPDSNATAEYAFGYADVTPNGSPSHLGDAVNPYTGYSNGKTGGDGFDLEWAVDITTGLPVDVTNKTFKYVRVYSNVLDNGAFGETSCEVCGIFTAYREANETSDVGRTAAPSSVVFSANNQNVTLSPVPVSGGTTAKISNIRSIAGNSETVNVTINAASGANVYVNGGKLTETSSGVFTGEVATPASGDMIRVITQTGNTAAHLFVIN